MILRGGFNVYPRELEEVMLTHPAVSLVAVVGVPDERLGEEVKAFVVKKPGAEVTEDALRAWCKEQFAAYKYPRLIEFRTELPTSATGKILKQGVARPIGSWTPSKPNFSTPIRRPSFAPSSRLARRSSPSSWAAAAIAADTAARARASWSRPTA